MKPYHFVLCFGLLLAACDDEMADVPRFEPMEASVHFPDGSSSRHPPLGTIARGQLDLDSALYHGRESRTRKAIETSPIAPTPSLLQRGREQFNVHCAPCHGADGYGNGIVVRRGFPPPPSYHSDRLRDSPDGHIFDVISNGYGKMYPFRSQIGVEDRWAIVSYIRALQLSQNAQLEDVIDPEAVQKLETERSEK